MTDKDIDGTFDFSLASPGDSALEDGFNEYGVRENFADDGETLESIDVIFGAMAPGVRKGVEVTPSFLKRVAGNYNRSIPLMLDHSQGQLKQTGKVTDVKYSEAQGNLRLMANIPDTGNTIKSDVIADFTHEPPAIEDGSVGFDHKSLEFDDPESDDALAKFVDGDLEEFSLTPFPAGYDENGGLSPRFSERLDSFLETSENDSEMEDSESQLVVNDSKLTTN